MFEGVNTISPKEIWETYKITPDMYLYLRELALSGSLSLTMPQEYVNYLQKEGYLLKQENNLVPTKKAKDIFEDKGEAMWYELVSIFPHKVPNGTGGYRPLRALDPDAKSNEKAKKKYLKIVKNNLSLHNHIIKVLSEEIKYRKSTTQFLFMHNLETWINQRDWEKFEFLLEEPEEDQRTNYGEQLV